MPSDTLKVLAEWWSEDEELYGLRQESNGLIDPTLAGESYVETSPFAVSLITALERGDVVLLPGEVVEKVQDALDEAANWMVELQNTDYDSSGAATDTRAVIANALEQLGGKEGE